MTVTLIVFLSVVAILTATIAALLVQRRALGRSEAFFRQLAEDAPMIMWTTREDATHDYLNKFSVEFTGMPLAGLLNEGWQAAVHPDDLERIIQSYVPAVAERQRVSMEYRLRRADGAYRWVLDTAIPKYEPDGRYSGYLGCSFDITERKLAEQALHESHRDIQRLAGRLIEAQDAERARIARDLHDDVSQQLAGVSIAFSGLRQRLAANQVSDSVQHEVAQLQQQTLTLARSVRHLSHDLHPTVLKHLGLVKGLTSYCGELERVHGLPMSCTAEGDFATMTPDAALCLYRIAQEALRNVVAHAGATRADVRLLQDGHQAEITISDDGRGMNAEEGKGLGLISISERAKSAGGSVRIESRPNQGTRVLATIPMNALVGKNLGLGPAGQVV